MALETIDVSGDGGIVKEILVQGAGETPPDGYEVEGTKERSGSLG